MFELDSELCEHIEKMLLVKRLKEKYPDRRLSDLYRMVFIN